MESTAPKSRNSSRGCVQFNNEVLASAQAIDEHSWCQLHELQCPACSGLGMPARQSSAQFDPLANLIRAGLNQPPARASTSGAWQDLSAPLPTEDCSGGSPAAGARLPSCCLSAMAVFALFRLPVRCELLVCHAIIHEQSTVQFLEVVVAQ